MAESRQPPGSGVMGATVSTRDVLAGAFLLITSVAGIVLFVRNADDAVAESAESDINQLRQSTVNVESDLEAELARLEADLLKRRDDTVATIDARITRLEDAFNADVDQVFSRLDDKIDSSVTRLSDERRTQRELILADIKDLQELLISAVRDLRQNKEVATRFERIETRIDEHEREIGALIERRRPTAD